MRAHARVSVWTLIVALGALGGPLLGQEASEFPASEWPAVRAAMEAGGVDAAVAHINGFDVPLERLQLYAHVQNTLTWEEWPGRDDLDNYIQLSDAAITSALWFASTAEDDEEAARYTNAANVFSYNLAAELAVCWPGDDRIREPRHLERGLEAARRCIVRRHRLGRSAESYSMAYWAAGVHLLALDRPGAAAEAFEEALFYAREAALEADEPASVGPRAGLNVLLNQGFSGLALWVAGDPAGRSRYRNVMNITHAQEARSEDQQAAFGAAFIRAQLERMRESVGLP
ncbi:MAG: hypothetical protein GF320_06090 [Armatimonadia bacterium]|nr:hypothetical protein [Armatimonadia bacterium]